MNYSPTLRRRRAKDGEPKTRPPVAALVPVARSSRMSASWRSTPGRCSWFDLMHGHTQSGPVSALAAADVHPAGARSAGGLLPVRPHGAAADGGADREMGRALPDRAGAGARAVQLLPG